jgi:hypothetical protein
MPQLLSVFPIQPPASHKHCWADMGAVGQGTCSPRCGVHVCCQQSRLENAQKQDKLRKHQAQSNSAFLPFI